MRIPYEDFIELRFPCWRLYFKPKQFEYYFPGMKPEEVMDDILFDKLTKAEIMNFCRFSRKVIRAREKYKRLKAG